MKSRTWRSTFIMWALLFTFCFLSTGAYAGSVSWFDPSSGAKIASLDVSQGEEFRLILKADVPANKTLKAYKFTVKYDKSMVSLVKAEKPAGSSFPPANVNYGTPGEIILNGFDSNGVNGPATISLLELTLKAESTPSTFSLGIQVNNFGLSNIDQFPPSAEEARVTVIGGQQQQTVSWFDPSSGAKITSLDVSQGEEFRLILKADVPANKTLKAYKFTVKYDKSMVSLVKADKPAGSSFPPANVNYGTPGEIILNGFDSNGINGPATISLLELTLKAESTPGTFSLSTQVNNFGSSNIDQFSPSAEEAGIILVPLPIVAKPELSPSYDVFFKNTISVTISCATPGATIRYTQDRSEPTESSPIYSEPLILTESTTIKAKGFKSNCTPSETAIGGYRKLPTLLPWGLGIEGSKGKVGQEVRIPVKIQDAPNKVSAFGFTVSYNEDILEYIGHERGELTASFNLLDVNPFGSGQLIIGGVTSEGAIPQGANGTLVWLKFKVKQGNKGWCYSLDIKDVKDGTAYFQTIGGFFCINPCEGDLNEDGEITPADALIAFQCYLRSGVCPDCSDVDENGEVTPNDALCLFRKYLGQTGCLDD